MNSARALRETRKKAGLTQADLARRAGTAQATISAYETGKKEPSVTTLCRLLAVMGARLEVGRVTPRVLSQEELEEAGRRLIRVMEFAETLPSYRDTPNRPAPQLPWRAS